ncbi:hypothetical protein [Autumnicola psychrophila]|uniref:Uncharacterized protein n=1 Tax=Autumnicola psychrophila TaxID=3075592 RepID=A0ABU3DPD7_9FLAO|nr:hypothetical protein [Zunongwangia sp. F225]MDT0685582.1 hypothetical protein [Zunongwangia sp. F225]
MIKFIGEPIAGEDFEYVLEGGDEVKHKILASVNNRIIYNQEDECDDPPCHEMIHIDPNYASEKILINYSNSEGESQSLEFEVRVRYLRR